MHTEFSLYAWESSSTRGSCGSKVENRRIQCKSWFFCLLATVGDGMDSVGFEIPVPENEI